MAKERQRPPLLIPERVKFQKRIESKKCVFDKLTELLEKGQSEVSKNTIFDALIAREKLGETNISHGIAIPRAHLKITYPRAALLVLKKGLKLNAADKQDIRIFLGLLIPTKYKEEFSVQLSELNKKLLKEDNLESMINSKNPELVSTYFEELFK